MFGSVEFISHCFSLSLSFYFSHENFPSTEPSSHLSLLFIFLFHSVAFQNDGWHEMKLSLSTTSRMCALIVSCRLKFSMYKHKGSIKSRFFSFWNENIEQICDDTAPMLETVPFVFNYNPLFNIQYIFCSVLLYRGLAQIYVYFSLFLNSRVCYSSAITFKCVSSVTIWCTYMFLHLFSGYFAFVLFSEKMLFFDKP